MLKILALLILSVLPLQWQQSKVPFADVATLMQFNTLTTFQHDTTDVVVIYTYLSCKPCLKLAKKLQETIEEEGLRQEAMIYFNTLDVDTNKVLYYLGDKRNTLAYYVAQGMVPMEGDYPKISFYDSIGQLDTTFFGYSRRNYKYIIDKLESLE